MVLEHGRPLSEAGRLEKELRVYDFLDRIGVSYDRIDHPPADTMEVCRAKNAILRATICKNLFLSNRQGTVFYLLMMPAEKHFKTSIVSKLIGSSRLSFGTDEKMAAFLDVTPGSVSVMGLINDTQNRVTLLIDSDILKGEFFGCHPCINTSSLKIKTQDLLEKILPAAHHIPKVIYIKGEENEETK